ncbi:serine hydrolase domain-containing protein [Sandaracinobacteroides saxicola]|uniref:Beta-lactamase family protein n=1 Tax=Sandaracinobacteroides saxicola TaxID=2759707 RepID=A0A7G5IDW6_9SPHN|nr:serine hydrolase domain-containing protein [Sandaracinobacteroides saxicola]QMW21558.1 beta-lactamase family protein [Sandaracinobacteroides saxicola]
MLCALSPGIAATPSPAAIAAPETSEASARLARFRDALDDARKTYGFPGAIAAFVLKDGSSGVVAVGVEGRHDPTPLVATARMMSGSTGKTFAAAAALRLAAQGKLDLDAPIGRYVSERPWFSKLANAAQITTRMLLAHRAGLADHVNLPDYMAQSSRRAAANPDDFLSPDECIAIAVAAPAKFAPGTGYAYSDSGYLIVGEIIENASGKRFYDYAATEFLTPLGLTLTVPSNTRLIPGLSQGEPDWGGAPLPPQMLVAPGVLLFNPASEWTGGGFATNPIDLARWARALYGGSLLPPALLADMARAPDGSPSDRPAYGLGMQIETLEGQRVVGHSGYFPGYRSDLFYMPEGDIAIAFQINSEFGVKSQPVIGAIRARLLHAAMMRKSQ